LNLLQAKGKGYVLEYRKVGKEGVTLEHGIGVALVGGKGQDVYVIYEHGAVIWLLEARDDAQ
jgi:hypothetical protein